MNIPTVRDIDGIRGARVLLRASLNVPVKDGRVAGDFRLRRNLDTVRFLQGAGARLIITGHVGDDGAESAAPVCEWFQKELQGVRFSEKFPDTRDLKESEIVILENLRKDPREKANDPALARALSGLADFFVNEAFSDSHRRHASIVGVPLHLPSFIGFNFEEEVSNLSVAFQPQHPFALIIGGAKFSTKLPLIERFLDAADTIFIGGALATDFYRAKGYEVGASLVSKEPPALARLLAHPKIILPRDTVIRAADGERMTVDARDVGPGDRILDNGPEFVADIAVAVRRARLVLWNGPLGNFEKGFWEGTHGVAQAVAASSARSIVGGGDTIAAIERLNLFNSFSFVSTGGGAMLDFLASGTLPGIEAIKHSPRMM